MGGKLIQQEFGLPEKRLSKAEYEDFSLRLQKTIADSGFQYKTAILQNFRDKESFGDLDILIEARSEVNYSKWLLETFGVKPFKNTSIYSLPVEGFQVDFILTPERNWDTTQWYFYGETGNIEGRTFHKFGLKWGHEGLVYVVRDELFDPTLQYDSSHVSSEIVVSRDFKEVAEIGGFDYEWRKRGFDSRDELFQYAIDCKYFDREIFRFENLNHINRTRNRKRPVYAAFVEYLEQNEPPSKYTFDKRSSYLPQWKERWPKLADEIEKQREKFFITKAIKEKFNGRLVMEWLNISDGPTVGQVVQQTKKEFPDLLNAKAEDIEKYVKSIKLNENSVCIPKGEGD